MKLIHYTDAPNQLFDLNNDPDEMNSLSNQRLENELLLGKLILD